MPKLKLNPWTFGKGERARLHWLCSPRREANGNWTVRAAFMPEDGSQFKILEYPWGTLPALIIGFDYVDGVPEKQAPDAIGRRIWIPDVKSGEINQAFDIDRQVFDFRNAKELGIEKVWRFYARGELFFVPCLEIIRAFLTPSKTLANLLLRPDGLESLIDDEKIEGDKITLKLSKEMPRNLVSNQNVAHLVWLLHNANAKRCWHSVFHNVFAEAIGAAPYNLADAMSNWLTITVEPPDIGSCALSVNAIRRQETHVITRINSFSLTDFPFRTVCYTHPSIKDVKTIAPRKDKPRFVRRDGGENFELDLDRSAAKPDSHQPLAEVFATTIEFRSSPRFVRIAQGEIAVPKKNSDSVSGIGGGGKVKVKETDETVSTDEPVRGGTVQPIEFGGLEMTKDSDVSGLKDFFQAVAEVQRQCQDFILDSTIVDVPGDKTFCLADNRKRTCAIVEVSRFDCSPCYIFEFSRPDDWSISTLFARFETDGSNPNEIKHNALEVILNAVNANGHWKRDKFPQDFLLNLELLKHTKNSANWSQRIMEKLHTLGFKMVKQN